jgi:hypothetical protein
MRSRSSKDGAVQTESSSCFDRIFQNDEVCADVGKIISFQIYFKSQNQGMKVTDMSLYGLIFCFTDF